MKKDYISKTIGGLTIMFSVFLFFAAAKQLTYQNEQIMANVTSGTKKEAPKIEESKEADNGIVSGNFNSASDGNIRYSYDENKEVIFYYKAIKSSKLKNENVSPVLKLEQDEGGKKTWKETQWSWIDYDEGILYFHYQTETKGEKKMEANYTGKYQVILDN